MLLPVWCVDVGVGNGVAAVDHHAVTDIDAHMGGPSGVVGSLEEDQVAGPGVGGGYRGADAQKPVGGLAAHAPAGMVDDPGDEAGAVKGSGRGPTKAIDPSIIFIS